jgi:hypothetical protein
MEDYICSREKRIFTTGNCVFPSKSGFALAKKDFSLWKIVYGLEKNDFS